MEIQVLVQGAKSPAKYECTGDMPTRKGQLVTLRNAKYGGWNRYEVVQMNGEVPVVKMVLTQ